MKEFTLPTRLITCLLPAIEMTLSMFSDMPKEMKDTPLFKQTLKDTLEARHLLHAALLRVDPADFEEQRQAIRDTGDTTVAKMAGISEAELTSIRSDGEAAREKKSAAILKLVPKNTEGEDDAT